MISRVLSTIRRNGVAWLALFVALGGTSLAASHYIITSTKQIKPSVLTALHGARGARGATGGAGAPGAEGSRGKEGPEGSRGKEGPAGPTGPAGNPGLRGESGLRGETGGEGKEGKEGREGKEGKEGKEGAKGEAGSALAFAHVEATGAVAASPNSKGFEGAVVENPGKEGIYCIHGLTVARHNVVVTVDDSESEAAYFATATVGKSKFVTSKVGTCSAETQITVELWSFALNGKGELEPQTKNGPFYIAVN